MQYRRDLSATLKFLALVLGLFIWYQIWLKPAYLTPHPEELSMKVVPMVPAPTTFPLPEALINPVWDVPPSRLVDIGSPPSQQLDLIREELNKGNYREVEQRLRTLSQKKLTNMATRRYIAAIWNNLGVQQEKFGGTALSVKAFRQSIGWDAQSSVAHLNLTQAYWELRDPAMTTQFLETVIRLAPEDPFPHLALADLLIAKGRHALAAIHIAQARPRAEREPNHQSYLRRLATKVDMIEPERTTISGAAPALPAPHSDNARPSRSLEVPVSPINESPAQTVLHQPAQPLSTHFTVQFDGPSDPTTWARIHAILNYAYEELPQKFGHIPTKPITVVLHTNQSFAGTSGSPVWADTLFDHSTGTIHLPTQGALEDLALFSRIARHEFAHALLIDHMRGAGPGVPGWLKEGLAIQLAEDPWSDIDESDTTARPLIPLTSLQGDWQQLSGDVAQTAYHEARSATQYLVGHYSMYGLRQLLSQVQTGQSFEAAMQQKLSVSYEEFQHRWEQIRHKPMRSSGS